jgi:aspartate-semialdehyde dehydrogenase
MKPIHVAIVGATGLVGQTFIKILEEKTFELGTLKLFASKKSQGKTLMFNNQTILLETIHEGCFKGIDYVLMSAGSEVSKKVAHQAVLEGAVVIDNSSAFRMEETIPLVVPEINLESAYHQTLIANPNCSTIQSVMPLKALQDAYGLIQIDYVTFQAVSGSGQKGLDDLNKETPSFYPYPIKKTAIPFIGEALDNGFSTEEMKMVLETKKILNQKDLKIHATCIRIPIKNGHGVHISATLKKDVSVRDIQNVLSLFPGLKVEDEPHINKYPTSIQAEGTDLVYVGRIKKDLDNPYKISMVVVADNIRKGAALNAIQIMKGLIDYANTH